MKKAKSSETKGKARPKTKATPVRQEEQFKPQEETAMGNLRCLRAEVAAQLEEQAQEPFITTSPLELLQPELERTRGEPLEPEVPISRRVNVWVCRPVAQQPVIEMVRWRVFELAVVKTRHLVGFAITTHCGRRSTAIVSIDPKTMRALTESGREYQLIGPPGYDDDAQYVLEMTTLASGQWTDVTNQVCNEFGITSTVN